MTGHYEVGTIRAMLQLHAMFSDGRGNLLNWLFLSTSGIHGSYDTLDDAQAFFDGAEDSDGDHENGTYPITVLVVNPRMVRMFYGNVDIRADDIPWLRCVVMSTIQAVTASQEGNIAEVLEVGR